MYQSARFWVGQEESLERKYRLEPGPDVRRAHEVAEASLTATLHRLREVDPSPQNAAVVARLVSLNHQYDNASDEMLLAVDAHDEAQVIHLDHAIVDPVFSAIHDIVTNHAAMAARHAGAESAAMRTDQAAATSATTVAFALGFALLAAFGLVIGGFRRRVDASRRAEVERLAAAAFTDPLTGLRNHRAFHEDLARSLHRVGRTGVPVSLVMLDLDGLKTINDAGGHQEGDRCPTALADAIHASERGSDCGYRVGGDEFAIILDNTRAWDAHLVVQRVRESLAGRSRPVSVSAGVSEAQKFTSAERLIREADLALLTTKRIGSGSAVYTSHMELEVAGFDSVEDEHHIQTLAGALALAVDAKDAYTRSHCQTVAQLCVLIAAELDLDSEPLARIAPAVCCTTSARSAYPTPSTKSRAR